MAGQRWEQEEIDALTWFVKKREKYKAALAQSGEHVRQTDRKWTWPDIAKKMQQTAERDGWQVKRTYEGGALHMAWQTIQAREIYQPTPKYEAEDEDEDEIMSGVEPQVKQEHGTGETVDAFPVESDIRVDASPAAAATPVRDAPITPSKPSNEVQVRFQNGIDHTVDVHFDPTANTIMIAPKPAAPATENIPESIPQIKLERGPDQALQGFSADTDRVLSFTLNSTAAPDLNTKAESYAAERQGIYSASPAPFDKHVTPTRSNTRWEDHELEALEWFVKKREEEPSNGRMNGRNRIWTWDAIATKMNKVATRDGWDSGRVYTGGNCYGAWLTKSTRLPTSRPSNRRKPTNRTHGVPVQRTQQFGLGDTVSSPNGPIQNTINPPPPGPDVALEPVPYHWLAAEREALHEVYNFSRISETKGLTRAECRRRGLWTWTMIAREMNRRAQSSTWNTGRVYDQSNCYNMIKYEKDNFNLQGNVQPLEPDDEDEDEDEDKDDDRDAYEYKV
ncbi:hypothetical protein DL98DRAFT_535515 [Cadophora sp. DSE1049]|nr:hypothetical protein DL98DRAFT_535515 [Cadophora sp. DSE1049]